MSFILFKIEISINCVSDNQSFKSKIKQFMHKVLLIDDANPSRSLLCDAKQE